jgi:PAS domain S-box-containing protein
VTFDEYGTILEINAAAGAMFQRSRDEMLGENISLLQLPATAEKHASYLEEFRATGVYAILGRRMEDVGLRADGTTFPTDLMVTEIHDKSRTCFTGILRDLTEQKRAEEELSRANAELRDLSRQAGMAEMATGVLHNVGGCGLPVTKIRFGPKHPVLLAGYAGGAKLPTTLWDWQTGRELFSLPDDIQGQAVDFSADGQRLAIGQARGGLIVYALPEGTKLLAIELGNGQRRIGFSAADRNRSVVGFRGQAIGLEYQ